MCRFNFWPLREQSIKMLRLAQPSSKFSIFFGSSGNFLTYFLKLNFKNTVLCKARILSIHLYLRQQEISMQYGLGQKYGKPKQTFFLDFRFYSFFLLNLKISISLQASKPTIVEFYSFTVEKKRSDCYCLANQCPYLCEFAPTNEGCHNFSILFYEKVSWIQRSLSKLSFFRRLIR